MIWQTSRFDIDLSQPRVMGIVNITPDSFSDGGAHASTRAALAHCEALLTQGADMLDLGGESSRPGAAPVPLELERARVLPVLREAVRLGVPVSVDTYKPELMQEALDLGADVINDIWALRQRTADGSRSAREVVAAHPRCGVCLMHMHREPQTMQAQPMEGDVLPQVLSFLERSVLALQGLGVDLARIAVDPGIGFGKTVAQNLALLARQDELLALGRPLLAGWSRKSTLGAVAAPAPGMQFPPGWHERMVPSVTAAVLAVQRGARVVRVHDVAATVQALQLWAAINGDWLAKPLD